MIRENKAKYNQVKVNTKSRKFGMRKPLSVVLALLLCVAMLPAGVYADTSSGSTVSQTASALSSATGTNTEYHSQGDIVRFMSLHPTDYDSNTKFKLESDMSVEYQKSLNMLNTIRYIAGIPYDVAINSKYNGFAQSATNVCVQNGEISHDLGSYTSQCNLGRISVSDCSVRWFLLDGYMEDDGDINKGVLGHRRWILNPVMASTGFGYASTADRGTFMSMYIWDNVGYSASQYGVMWPARNMPLSYFTQKSPWSYSYGEKLDEGKYNIAVDMTDNNNPDRQWHFSNTSLESGNFYVNNQYFGQPGCIIWEPKDIPAYADGDSYHVRISNRFDNSVIADYDVNFFDSNNYLAPGAFQFTDLSLDSEEGCPALRWTRSADADYYEIYRQAYGSGNWKCIDPEFKPLFNYSSDIEYLDPSVSKGIKYVYRVTAVNLVNGKCYTTSADSKSINSSSMSERSISTKLGKVTISSAKAYAKKKNQLKWKSVSKASGYKIYRRLYGNSKWTLVKTITKSSTLSWKDTSAKSGKKYQYRIRAYRKNFGNYVYGSYSSIKTVKTK